MLSCLGPKVAIELASPQLWRSHLGWSPNESRMQALTTLFVQSGRNLCFASELSELLRSCASASVHVFVCCVFLSWLGYVECRFCVGLWKSLI